MEKAIATLKQRFTTPSADEMQQHPLCSICWTDYGGEDQAVKLPCGHVFGEECVIAWASGVTPMGRHNGCPYCRAELLPPSMDSRFKALTSLMSDIMSEVPTLSIIYGGPYGVAIAVLLDAIFFVKAYLKLSPFWLAVLGLASGAQFVNMVRMILKLQGWRWTWLSVAVALFGAIREMNSYTGTSWHWYLLDEAGTLATAQ